MFVDKDQRKIGQILADEADERTELWLARRAAEFPNGNIRSVLCRQRHVDRLKNLKHLSLYENQLESIGDIGALSSCKHLETLDLGKNRLCDALPDELAELRGSLVELHAEDNELSRLGHGVLGLAKLQVLRFSGNEIESIPHDIDVCLPHLKSLYLDENRLSSIPASLGNLKQLKRLNLRKNQLTFLPDSLAQLSNLEALILSSNQLVDFLDPSVIAGLSSLKKLLLNGNRLERLAPELASLEGCKINVANNFISEIPIVISDAFPDINISHQNVKAVEDEKNANPASPGGAAATATAEVVEVEDPADAAMEIVQLEDAPLQEGAEKGLPVMEIESV